MYLRIAPHALSSHTDTHTHIESERDQREKYRPTGGSFFAHTIFIFVWDYYRPLHGNYCGLTVAKFMGKYGVI